MKTTLKIFNPVWGVDVARDWGLEAEEVDLETALQESFKIACVPACFTKPHNFNYSGYQQSQLTIDLSQFDLVLVSDIEQERLSWIENWIKEQKIKNYLLAVGSTHSGEKFIDSNNTVLRFWWMYNTMRMNSLEDHQHPDKPYWFDALLGARRPHRDFVMLNMQKHSVLLNKSIVTYRDGFPGEIIDEQSTKMQNCFPNIELQWPYVSPNLDHAWELKDAIGKITGPIQSISPYIPWEIYKNTWYTVLCENGFTGDAFFLTEKTSKAMLAQRVFVMFAPAFFLRHLKFLGFRTFNGIIDESYDEEFIDVKRFQMAFREMLSLPQRDPVEIYKQAQDILEHNRQRMFELQNETKGKMQELLQATIPKPFFI